MSKTHDQASVPPSCGILLVVSPTVETGGYFLLTELTMPASGYTENPIRQNLFRAGHGKAVRDVDEANLSAGKARAGIDSLGRDLP